MKDNKYLGDILWLEPRQPKDCPMVVVDGTEYIDITDMLFEDTKYIKEYLTAQQIKQRERERTKRIVGDLKIEHKKPGRVPKEITDEQKEKIIQLYNEGLTYQNIAGTVGIGYGKTQRLLTGMLKRGELKKRTGASITIARKKGRVMA